MVKRKRVNGFRDLGRCGLILAVTVAVIRCSFSAGEPWGHLNSTVDVAFFPPDTRIDAAGALKTALGYRVDVESITAAIDKLVFSIQSEGSGDAEFDPANPPAGYSLCHNGHCHSASGELVAYEEIAQSLGGGSSGGQSVVVAVDGAGKVGINQSMAVAVPECGDACDTPRGVLQEVKVTVKTVALAGRITDSTTQGRLPAEGVDVTLTMAGPMVVSALVHTVFGKGEPLQKKVSLTVKIPAELVDTVDWGALPVTADQNGVWGLVLSDVEQKQIQDSIAGAFAKYAVLEVVID